jgi:hypothetical protein
MTQSFTDWLETSRYVVVSVDPAAGRLRVRGTGDACQDLSCQPELRVQAEEGMLTGLAGVNAGDIVRLESREGRATEVVIVRRVWDELTSPEF